MAKVNETIDDSLDGDDDSDVEQKKPDVVAGGSKNPLVCSSEYTDPGYWMSMLGATITFVLIVLCSLALFLPWWTLTTVEDAGSSWKEVGLWEITTTFTAQLQEAMHEGCLNACDQTRVIRNKVRIDSTSWAQICRPATGDLAQTCNQIYAIRIGVALTFVVGFIYVGWAFVSFYGSNQRAVNRFPAVVGLVIAILNLVFLLGTQLVALAVGGSQGDLNGPGFALFVVALVVSLPAVIVSTMAKTITDGITQVLPEEKLPARGEAVNAQDHGIFAVDKHNTNRLQASAYAWGVTKHEPEAEADLEGA